MLTKEQLAILNRADRSGMIVVGDSDICPGIHFCREWDSLPICVASPEWDACLCNVNIKDKEPS